MTDPASFWIQSTDEPSFKPLEGDAEVDVAVLGAGITGVTAAHLLKEAGRTVALVESRRVLQGATGYTTAKVTSGHGLVYAQLAHSLGEETACAYAAANEWAKEWIASLVDERGIQCEFERRDNLVYTESESEVSQLEQEVIAMRRAGLEASLVRETSLPTRSRRR